MTTCMRLVALLSVLAISSYAADKPVEQQIEEAVLPLPEAQRDAASVVVYEAGVRKVLRQGTNSLICQPDDPDAPGFAIWCYPKTHDAYARRWYQLEAEGNAPAEVNAMIAKEIEAGKLEWPDAAVNYNLRGPGLDNAVPLTVVFVPFATGESIGLTEQRDHHRPWLMSTGTAFAHIMIPGK